MQGKGKESNATANGSKSAQEPKADANGASATAQQDTAMADAAEPATGSSSSYTGQATGMRLMASMPCEA